MENIYHGQKRNEKGGDISVVFFAWAFLDLDLDLIVILYSMYR